MTENLDLDSWNLEIKADAILSQLEEYGGLFNDILWLKKVKHPGREVDLLSQYRSLKN